MKTMFLVIAVCMTLLALGATSAAAQPGETIVKKAPVPLMLDPQVNMFRIGPPAVDLFSPDRAKSSTITIHFLHAGETGFWDDIAIDWPTGASNALLYAIKVWEYYVDSSVPITIEATMCANLGAGILGHSGATVAHSGFSGALVANTYYDAALANALHGSDLSPANNDMAMAFSAAFSWYYETNGSPSGSQVDFVSVVLHEICHGLGFNGSMDVSGGVGSWGFGGRPWIYDRFTETNPGTNLINTAFYPNPSTALGDALQSGNVYFNGTDANAANGGYRVKLYAPGTWNGGSSYAHLDTIFDGTTNALMTWAIAYGEVVHDPGPVTIGLLQDLGWNNVPEPGCCAALLLIGWGLRRSAARL